MDTDQKLWAQQAANHGWLASDILRMREPRAAAGEAVVVAAAEWKQVTLRWDLWRSTRPAIIVLHHQAHPSQVDSLARAAAVHGMDPNLHQAALILGKRQSKGKGKGKAAAEVVPEGDAGLVVLLFRSGGDQDAEKLAAAIASWSGSDGAHTSAQDSIADRIDWFGQRVAVFVEGGSAGDASDAAASLATLGAVVVAAGSGPLLHQTAATQPRTLARKGKGKAASGKGKNKERDEDDSKASVQNDHAGASSAVYQEEYVRFLGNVWNALQAPVETRRWRSGVAVLSSTGMLHSLLPQRISSSSSSSHKTSADGNEEEAPHQQSLTATGRTRWYSRYLAQLSRPEVWWWTFMVGVTAWVAAVVMNVNSLNPSDDVSLGSRSTGSSTTGRR